MPNTRPFLSIQGLLCGAIIVATAAHGHAADLMYGTGPLKPKEVARFKDPELVKEVVKYVKYFKMTEVGRIGPDGKREIAWSADDPATDTVEKLNRAERIGLLSALRRKTIGIEVDLYVPLDEGFAPATVFWNKEDVADIQAGPRFKETYPGPAPTIDAIREKYGVGEMSEEGTKWTPQELWAVEKALSLLSPEELESVKGVPFVRKPSGRRHRALYTRGPHPARIDVYDSTFSFDHDTFIGTVDKHYPDSVGVLLHELGHGIVDLRYRQALAEAKIAEKAYHENVAQQKAGTGDAAKLKAENNRLYELANGGITTLNNIDNVNKRAGGRPAEQAFGKVLPKAKCGTRYGRKNFGECFAESFRLFKADPAALERVGGQDAKTWFSAGNHVKEAKATEVKK